MLSSDTEKLSCVGEDMVAPVMRSRVKMTEGVWQFKKKSKLHCSEGTQVLGKSRRNGEGSQNEFL